MTKYVLIIGDGMADNPVTDLGGKTPLEKAGIPNIHLLAARGTVGSVLTVPEGMPPGSDTAILSIFGADPRSCFTGRSPLEAAAGGISLEPGDVSYRCNMVSFEEGDMPFEARRILSHSGGSVEGAESIRLAEDLFSHPEFGSAAKAAGIRIHPSPSFRHIAVQKGAKISGLIATPPHDVLDLPIGPNLPRGCANAGTLLELMKLAHRVLDRHPINEKRRGAGLLPANGIWFWAEGTAVALDSFPKKYGKTGMVVSAVPLVQGIARLAGLDIALVEGATGELETNYEGKADAAVQALRKGYDFAAVHVEAPDECTHNGDLAGKLKAIENLDTRVVARLIRQLDDEKFDYRILLLSDHKTLTVTRGHDGDPVPFLLYQSGRDTGRGLPYSERTGEAGPFVTEGTKLMEILFRTGGNTYEN